MADRWEGAHTVHGTLASITLAPDVDLEIQVIDVTMTALQQVDGITRARILDYLCERFEERALETLRSEPNEDRDKLRAEVSEGIANLQAIASWARGSDGRSGGV